MITCPYLIHALSPLHAGTGHAADIIDLPIARMKATGIPFVPGSGIKGVLRDRCLRPPGADPAEAEARRRVLLTFGPEFADAAGYAGALIVGDARLLALPVRSFRGTFAWVSSPLLLTLAARDLGDKAPAKPRCEGTRALVTKGSVNAYQKKVYLEDLDLSADTNDAVEEWASCIARVACPNEEDVFTRRFVVVDDETMTFLWETQTQIDTRVRIDPKTGTVAKGALWIEESLPPETLLVGVFLADRPRTGKKDRENGDDMTAEDVLKVALPDRAETVQLGGKATVGRGRCRLALWEATA